MNLWYIWGKIDACKNHNNLLCLSWQKIIRFIVRMYGTVPVHTVIFVSFDNFRQPNMKIIRSRKFGSKKNYGSFYSYSTIQVLLMYRTVPVQVHLIYFFFFKNLSYITVVRYSTIWYRTIEYIRKLKRNRHQTSPKNYSEWRFYLPNYDWFKTATTFQKKVQKSFLFPH